MTTLTQTIDAIREYRPTLDKYPILSAEDELELCKRLKHQNDLKAAEILVLSHLRLVIKIARQFENYGQRMDDLIHEGIIGMMKAVKTFDYTKGVRLAHHAMFYIKGEIRGFIQENFRLVKIATTNIHRTLLFNRQVVNSSESLEEVSKTLNLPLEQVKEFEQRYNSGYDVELEQTYSDGKPKETSIVDFSQEPTNILESAQHEWLLTEGIQNALKQLDERTRDIIQSRWLDEEPKTMKELSEIYGVSIARIGQIEQVGFKKLREILK